MNCFHQNNEYVVYHIYTGRVREEDLPSHHKFGAVTVADGRGVLPISLELKETHKELLCGRNFC